MTQKTFRAMVAEETADGGFARKITEKYQDDLPEGDVLIRVMYSSLNYKDALSATGNRGVTKNYPHTPGIDASGIVEESRTHDFRPGDEVLVTGYDLGMNTSGGFGQYIRVPAGWVVKLPENLSLKESMIYGTAGFTATLSVLRLTGHGVTPDHGEILVTGASGGVGSIAASTLAKLGYHVVAVSGKPDAARFLTSLGVKEVISREEATDTTKRPLLKARWAGVIDTVGGDMLATALRSTTQRAAVSTCGNVASAELNITVYPFILRGVSLYGIDSAACPMTPRLAAWEKIAGEWKLDHLERLASEIGLDDLNENIDLILQGKLKGRTVINLIK